MGVFTNLEPIGIYIGMKKHHSSMNSDFSTIHHKIHYIFGFKSLLSTPRAISGYHLLFFGFKTNQVSFTMHYSMYLWFIVMESKHLG